MLKPAMAIAAVLGVLPGAAAAHPAPFSYLDVHVGRAEVSGRLVVHAIDLAYELGLSSPDALADETVVGGHARAIASLLARRLTIAADGRRIEWTMTAAAPAEGQDAVDLLWRASLPAPPGRVTIDALLFPYDPVHQTFVNVYEGGVLVWQEVLNRDRTHVVFYTGTRQGRLAVVRHFTASGVHHIAIGPDHILFIVGLLLLGGTVMRLLGIVTAFTIGHSVTLALAALDVFNPPAGVVEPAIALSIVYVGADNLLSGGRGRDVRVWIALFFGLVHGFGFAGVLRETGLPREALVLSLFAFNVGVEIGQAAIVVVVTAALDLLRRRHAILARVVVTAGSVLVMVAGAYWFAERVWQTRG